ncbi:MAG: bifunctional DNA primase/polymerase [Anaerolineae bacterium]|nr:bifunctional DNA primase/polymerase [Anaerolineae bacterium]
MSQETLNYKAAKYYAQLGWSVLPLHWPEGRGCSCHRPDCASIGKHPRTEAGAYDANTDPDQIFQWWQRWPQANIGLNVGRTGLVVIDIDPAHGGHIRDLPLSTTERCTTTVTTGGNGIHYYFTAPLRLAISNSNKRCPPGIDVRAGDGAYVVAPLSRHASGQRYQFVRGREPWNSPPLSLPTSLLSILTIKNEPTQRSEPPHIPEGARHPYAEKALQDEVGRLAQAREGIRNTTLNAVAFSLGQLVGVGLLNRTEVEHQLMQVAHSIGLGETETFKTLQSGLEAGIRTPRRQWPE